MFWNSLWVNLLFGVLLVALGAGGLFVGFEYAAYEETIADREVTVPGEVTSTNVYQLPDGNWTYTFSYEYEFDQRAEVEAQDLAEHYPGSLNDTRTYTQDEEGGKSSSQSSARDSMWSNFNEDGPDPDVTTPTVTVYVDPYYPSEGSLSDASSLAPEFFQYAGAALIAIGLLLNARMARRITT